MRNMSFLILVLALAVLAAIASLELHPVAVDDSATIARQASQLTQQKLAWPNAFPWPNSKDGLVCEPIGCIRDREGAYWVDLIVVGDEMPVLSAVSVIHTASFRRQLLVPAKVSTDRTISVVDKGDVPEQRHDFTLPTSVDPIHIKDIASGHFDAPRASWSIIRVLVYDKSCLRSIDEAGVLPAISDKVADQLEKVARHWTGEKEPAAPLFEFRTRLVPVTQSE